jgi:deferrochelatase/peroxidase EfeB
MSKKTQGRKIAGYKLEIKRTGKTGKWERVGFLFNSAYEANEYKKRHYPDVKIAQVYAVRIDYTPIELAGYQNGTGNALTREQKQEKHLAFQKRKAA